MIERDLKSLILKAWMRRFVEKTVKTTSRSSTLIRQHSVLIDNFDVRFVEICLVFLISFLFKDNFLTQILPTCGKSFSRSGAGV